MYILRGRRDDAFSMGILALRVLAFKYVPNHRRVRIVWVRWIIQVKNTPL